jgi:guanylate kinase
MGTGKCLIFSAPSGAGKTTIVRHLLGIKELGLSFSISATTRAARNYETDGSDYYFLTEEEFLRRIDNKEFVEWEEVYPGQFYGTLRSELERIWSLGRHAIFDVDVVGGLDLKEEFKDDALAVFVSPPDLGTLEERLLSRGTETQEKVNERLRKAAFEIQFADKFDVVLENKDLKETLKQAERIVLEFITG